ncbi:acyl--CoA ligase [Shimia sp. NS0008-38b]|uniref:class I adenylate-forming enzyme family protein n=1 Tax=Shimia sp. NS0008-38b TaxID=3127653 RepID=UPI00310475D2
MHSVFDKGAPPACPNAFNMAAHVLRHAQDKSDKVALRVLSENDPEDWTYGALESAVLGAGTGLLDAGLQPGQRVLMRLGNSVHFPIAFLACIAVGLIPVPTSSQLTKSEVDGMVTSLKPAAILQDPSVETTSITSTKILTINNLISFYGLSSATYELGNPNRPAYIVYTSGTSGRPRAVVHAHRAISARQMMFEDWYALKPSDRLLHAGAFNWTFTLGTGLMDPWTIGATALIPAPNTSPTALADLLHRHQATLFAAAPGVYRKMLDTPDDPALTKLHDSLRHGLCAGEKLSTPMRQRWSKATGTPLFEAFGMSECSTFISSNPTSQSPNGALGQPQRGRRVAIVDENGPVPLGAPGTIAVHKTDPGLMLGYLDAPDDTAERFKGDWFLTGDLGTMDAAGFITYMGRTDDMMNAGGFRVSPLEVESALLSHPQIKGIAVTDVEIKPDTRVIAAFYTADHDLVAHDLKAFAAQRLARYKQPRLFTRLDTLPTNANGKLNRRALRANFKATT